MFPFPIHQVPDSAYPIVEATSGGSVAADSTPTLTLPADIEAGDLIYIYLQTESSAAADWSGTDFTEQCDVTSGGASFSCAYLWAEGGETSVTPTIAAAVDVTYQCYRISGVYDETTPARDPIGSLWTDTPNPGTCTTSWGSAKNLWISFVGAVASVSVSDQPDDFTDLLVETTSGRPTIMSTQREEETASQNPTSYTISETTRTFTIVLGIRGT